MSKRTRPEDAAWSDYAGKLATNLQRLRHERGLSQEDVAYRSGQKYEKGESKPGTPANPTIRTLLAMSQALDVDLTEILPPDAPDLRLR